VVDSSTENNVRTIVAKPNQSATWRTNLWVLGMIAVPSLGAAIGFTLLGAWPILPFAGAELLALGFALYYVSWKLQYRHIITLDERSVRIDKGFYAPVRSWTFTRDDCRLAITPEQHPWDGPDLAVHNREQTVSVGEFLNREDSLALLALLRRELATGTHSETDWRKL